MKKLTFVLGSLFLVAAFALPSFAHTFYNNSHSHDLAARPHTERIAPLNYYQQLYREYYRCGSQGCQTEQRIQAPAKPALVNRYGRTIEREVTAENVNNTSRRANTYQNRYLVVRNGNYVDRLGYDASTRSNVSRSTYNVADSGDYSVSSPRGFVRTTTGDYRAKGTSLAYRVLSLDQTRCTSQNFWACAQSQNRAFRGKDGFSVVRNTQTSYRWNQTAHTDFEYFPTVTESFDAVVNGRAYTYYTYTALNPADNTMIRIEGVSTSREKPTAAQTAFQVFETFRFQ